MANKRLPQAERLLSGSITESLDESTTEVDVSNPPSASKLPTYWELEPDSADVRELTRVIGVSGSTVTLERGLNNGGTGYPHQANSAYKQKITSRHWDAVVEALEDAWLMEDASYAFAKDDADTFTITGTGYDATAYYTKGRLVRLNETNICVVEDSSYSANVTTVNLKSGTIPTTITSVEIAVQPKGAADLIALRKATGTTINTGTADDEIVTPKSIMDSDLAYLTDMPVKNTAAEIDTGTDDDKFVTALGLATRMESYGWTPARETWTYASAVSITVPSNATLKYQAGDKIRLKQGAGYKYYFVVAVGATSLTVLGGSDYTVANAAITDNDYSRSEDPFGYPAAFATGTITWDTTQIDNGTGGQQPTAGKSYYKVKGRRVDHWLSLGATNVFKNGAGPFCYFAIPATMPAPSSTYHNAYQVMGEGSFVGAISKGAVLGPRGSLADVHFYTADASNIADNTQLTDMSGHYSYLF